jgi:hypothetical protein
MDFIELHKKQKNPKSVDISWGLVFIGSYWNGIWWRERRPTAKQPQSLRTS